MSYLHESSNLYIPFIFIFPFILQVTFWQLWRIAISSARARQMVTCRSGSKESSGHWIISLRYTGRDVAALLHRYVPAAFPFWICSLKYESRLNSITTRLDSKNLELFSFIQMCFMYYAFIYHPSVLFVPLTCRGVMLCQDLIQIMFFLYSRYTI